MRPSKGKHCPLIQKKCIEERCAFYQDMIWRQGEESEVRWNCSINWAVVMQIEMAKETRHTSASTDAMRNAFDLRAGQALLKMAAGMSQLENRDESNHQPRLRDGGQGHSGSSDR